MVYGNYGKDSLNGQFYTRNIVTGDKAIQGEYFQNKFNAIGTSGSNIANIAKNYHTELEKIARAVEDHFKEIRSIRFTVENKRLWLIDQRSVMTKSTQADIRLLLDLHARKIVTDTYVVKQIKPGQLNEILHPIIDFTTVKGMKMPDGRHHRCSGGRDRPGLLFHRRPPGGPQDCPAEGAGHEAHPLPRLLLRGRREGHRGGHRRSFHGGRVFGARLSRCAPVREGFPRKTRYEDQGKPGDNRRA